MGNSGFFAIGSTCWETMRPVHMGVQLAFPILPDPAYPRPARKDDTTVSAEVAAHAPVSQAFVQQRLFHRPGLLSGRCCRSAGRPFGAERTRYFGRYAASFLR